MTTNQETSLRERLLAYAAKHPALWTAGEVTTLLREAEAALSARDEAGAVYRCDYCGSDYTRAKYCCQARREYLNAHGEYEIATPPAQEHPMTDTTSLRELIGSLQSMRDRLVGELPGHFGDAFDGDFDTLLDAINHLKCELAGRARPARNPAFVGEWNAKAVALGYDGVADLLSAVERGDPPTHVSRVLASAGVPASLARPEAQGEKCPHCGAPCRKEVLMRGGDNGWGDDESRTVYRFSPPADRAPGGVDGDVIHAAVAYFNGLNTKASLHMAAEIEKCYAALTHQEPAR